MDICIPYVVNRLNALVRKPEKTVFQNSFIAVWRIIAVSLSPFVSFSPFADSRTFGVTQDL